MTAGEDLGEEVRLSTVIRIPHRVKNQLRILCARRGMAMRDYVEQLVRTALGVQVIPPGRAGMRTRKGTTPAEFDEPRQCKYGCGHRSKNKAGLAQHEADCTLQRSRRAQERAKQIEAERERADGEAS